MTQLLLRHECGCLLFRSQVLHTQALCERHQRMVRVDSSVNWMHFVYALLGGGIASKEGPRPSDRKA